ncbi:MAG TPA: CBS domain-containing protein [Sedimentisphaerales bacterium]|nr:CBS domain-containing protein [Sedimentisphaerales bacterium]
MLTAKDIMTKHIISVKADTPIYDVLELIAKHDISGLPVVEDDLTLIGIISEKDVLSLFYDSEEECQKTVDDFMTQPPLFFDADESLLDVCDFLKKNVFRRVPITSKGKLVGIISIRDVIEYILQLRGEKIAIG